VPLEATDIRLIKAKLINIKKDIISLLILINYKYTNIQIYKYTNIQILY